MARIENQTTKYPRYLVCGDSAICVEFGNEISPAINTKIKAFYQTLKSKNIDGIEDIIPTFRSVLINYSPQKLLYSDMLILVKGVLSEAQTSRDAVSRIFKIPVCYGGEFGPDLNDIAEHAGLSVEEVISIHSKKPYLIYMLGFLPGFCYLGGLDERIFTPRMVKPRTKIPTGSVGIGGEQTGIYPMESPAGWRLLGRTPVRTYDPNREIPILYEAGDYIQFVPITEDEYYTIQHEVEDGTYEYDIMTY